MFLVRPNGLYSYWPTVTSRYNKFKVIRFEYIVDCKPWYYTEVIRAVLCTCCCFRVRLLFAGWLCRGRWDNTAGIQWEKYRWLHPLFTEGFTVTNSQLRPDSINQLWFAYISTSTLSKMLTNKIVIYDEYIKRSMGWIQINVGLCLRRLWSLHYHYLFFKTRSK